jgi:hypothetical protein
VDSDSNDDMLDQSESLDSDEVRNDDGDEVVDPPEHWIEAEDHESLDEKLAAEISDGRPEMHTIQTRVADSMSSAMTIWTASTSACTAAPAARSTGRRKTATRSSTWKGELRVGIIAAE